MNTNMTGFRWLSKIFASLLWTKVALAFEGLKDYISPCLRPKVLEICSSRQCILNDERDSDILLFKEIEVPYCLCHGK